MSFKEFMMAGGYDVLLNNLETHEWDEMNTYKDKFIELLRQYYFTGGMPEVVEYYFRTKDIHGTRNIQNRILNDYDQDFSKHIPAATLAKVRLVYNSIPSQLAKENKKFIYGAIKKGGRAKEFEDAIQWLVNAGLIYRVARIKKIEMPVKFYEEYESFKLFLSDLGLLGAMSNVPASQILVGDNVFSEYKGAFTEQYVAQQIKTEGIVPYYYTNANSTMEIDFVIQKEEVHPIEVKAEENLRSKSLKTVIENNPELTGWRFSMSGYRNQDWLINIPLPLIQEWIKAAK
jgi:predicted AAA+ superfamily ATPase